MSVQYPDPLSLPHVIGLACTPTPTTGSRAIIHAATLEDESQVGSGAQVLDKAVIQTHAVVAPGAVVTPGKVVKTGQVGWMRHYYLVDTLIP